MQPYEWKEAASLLNLCAQCPYRRQCITTVNPAHNWSDGIVGGYLFLNGRPMVKELKRIQPIERPFHDTETLDWYYQSLPQK